MAEQTDVVPVRVSLSVSDLSSLVWQALEDSGVDMDDYCPRTAIRFTIMRLDELGLLVRGS